MALQAMRLSFRIGDALKLQGQHRGSQIARFHPAAGAISQVRSDDWKTLQLTQPRFEPEAAVCNTWRVAANFSWPRL